MTTASPLQNRRAGVLAHLTSLPSQHGIGDMGPSARRFADWITSCGMTLWQTLPLVPTDLGLSPYSSWSAFCGNPWLISPEDLVRDGYLEAHEINCAPVPVENMCFETFTSHKGPMLERAAARVVASRSGAKNGSYDAWHADNPWADDAILFSALSHKYELPWWEWPEALRRRDAAALVQAMDTLRDEIDQGLALQFLFDQQLAGLRAYCASKNILMVGDVPIYVSPDSADVWAHQSVFELADDGQCKEVAGVPPDYFSEIGQLWGNPLYDWDNPATLVWWTDRVRRCMQQADVVRIDHFRGIAAYWAVPADAEDARAGRWRPGPGPKFFEHLERELGPLPIIAEDLGDIDEDVHALRNSAGLPGMHVLQFAFGSDSDNTHLPHNHLPLSVAYTSTHDNDTLLGWWFRIEEWERDRVRHYLSINGHDVVWDLIRTAIASVARFAVVPLQDILALPTECRMNTPGTTTGNWQWRFEESALRNDTAERLREFVQRYGRD